MRSSHTEVETVLKERIAAELPVYAYVAPLDKAARISSLRQVRPTPIPWL